MNWLLPMSRCAVMRPAISTWLPSFNSLATYFVRAWPQPSVGVNLFANGLMPFALSFARFVRRCSISEFSDGGVGPDGCSINESGDETRWRARVQLRNHWAGSAG